MCSLYGKQTVGDKKKEDQWGGYDSSGDKYPGLDQGSIVTVDGFRVLFKCTIAKN